MAYAIILLLVIIACGGKVNAENQKRQSLSRERDFLKRSFGFSRPSKTNKLDIRSKEPIKLQSVARSLPSRVKSKFLLFYLLSYILYDNNNINNNN